MRKKLLTGAVTLGLASSVLVLGATSASADEFSIWLDERPTASTSIPWSTSGEICDDPTVKVIHEDPSEGEPNPVSSEVISINADQATGSIDISSLTPGYIYVSIECADDVFDVNFSLARYTVTKEIEGDAPAGAAFEFQVTAEPENPDVAPVVFDFELAAGESASFYDFDVTTWSVEETNDHGASEVRADGTQFTSEEAEDFVATVVNVFPEAQDPDPEPTPTPEPDPEPQPDPTPGPDPTPDSTAAAPVKAQPTFTG